MLKSVDPSHAHTADADRLQKACEAEDGSCDETTYRSEGQCGHGDRVTLNVMASGPMFR